jgi:hypothetical protein
MRIHFYRRFSDLDNVHEFGVVSDNPSDVYFAWVFFYLGVYLSKEDFNIRLFPYKVYLWEKPVKTYKINGAEKVAKLITNRIKKIIND